mmetsp:Transcript_19555/g.57707  ORF Transcript_19555/g.57707 Transcript_19555/m.57707 type:complete len:408 (-) Transcript_19555:559-1782(-)
MRVVRLHRNDARRGTRSRGSARPAIAPERAPSGRRSRPQLAAVPNPPVATTRREMSRGAPVKTQNCGRRVRGLARPPSHGDKPSTHSPRAAASRASRLDAQLHLVRLFRGGSGAIAVPVGLAHHRLDVAAVLILFRDRLHLLEEALRRVEEDGVEAEELELLVGHVQGVLRRLLARVGHELQRRAGLVGDELGEVAHARRLRHLVEDLHGGARLGRVVDGELDAAAGVAHVDERTRLAARAVDREGDPEGALHEEAVEHRAIVAVVVEAVHKALVPRCLLRVRAPDDALVEVRDAYAVVLHVKLEEKRVEALGRVVDGAGVGGVEDALLATTGENHVNVALGDLAAAVPVAVHAHGAEMDQVDVETRFDDCREHVVRGANVVIDGVALVARGLHRIRGGALLSKVHN